MKNNYWTKKDIKKFHKKLLKTRKGEDARKYAGDVTAKVIINISKKYLGKSILDVGSGSGALILNLKKKYINKNITGIDLLGQPENNVIEGDVTNLKFNKEEFDTIFCTEVLEHLNNLDLKKAVKEISRVLVKKGILIITTPYNEKLKENIVFCPECHYSFHRVGHQQTFNEKRIKDLFLDFNIIRVHVLNLGFIVKYPIMARLLYFLKIPKFIKMPKLFYKNMLIILQKVK